MKIIYYLYIYKLDKLKKHTKMKYEIKMTIFFGS